MRCIVMRAAPVVTPGGSASPADARFDPFWARVNEAGITVAYHSGDSGYLKFAQAWGVGGDFKSFDFNPVRLCLSPQPVADLLAALVCGGLLDRHRNLRIATIETGSSWVPGLLKRFKKACEKEGLTKDLKRVAYYEKPSEKRRRRVRKGPPLAMRTGGGGRSSR